ncbi:MAG: hypothetical protein ACI9R3_005534 [Verrucomicrobiales bacterium]|jgi:hypothetical protein
MLADSMHRFRAKFEWVYAQHNGRGVEKDESLVASNSFSPTTNGFRCNVVDFSDTTAVMLLEALSKSI